MSELDQIDRGGARLTIDIADAGDRKRIYALRHQVYALELGQHAANDDRTLSDSLDASNTYIVARRGGEIIGFVAITAPGEAGYSIDKYFLRSEVPITFDDGLYEIRLLTVLPEWRGSRAALALMYAALRHVESRGGTRIVAIGRVELLPMYERVGLRPLGLRVPAGRVAYELMMMEPGRGHAIDPGLLRVVERDTDWRMKGVAFRRAGSCYHGGAFFEAIGDEFDDLGARSRIINADVLDAWFEPAPAVVQTLRANLSWVLRTSPPTSCEGMQRTIARARGVPEASIVCGAGSSDLIYLALRHWLDARSRVLILDPMYGEYAHVLEQVVGCRVDRLRLFREDTYQVSLDDLASRIRCGAYDWVILVNPNSPTGQMIDRASLESLIAGTPRATRFWVDETYVDYAGESCSIEAFAAASKNAVVCKSMSKVYALSGVRSAYLCAPPHMSDELRALAPPWAVGLPAQIAACEAMRNLDYYRLRWEETHTLRQTLTVRLASLGWDVVPGCANFILCHIPAGHPPADAIVRECRARGLFIRDVASMGRCFGDRTVRVAVKDRDTNAEMLRRLGAALLSLSALAPQDLTDFLSSSRCFSKSPLASISGR